MPRPYSIATTELLDAADKLVASSRRRIVSSRRHVAASRPLLHIRSVEVRPEFSGGVTWAVYVREMKLLGLCPMGHRLPCSQDSVASQGVQAQP